METPVNSGIHQDTRLLVEVRLNKNKRDETLKVKIYQHLLRKLSGEHDDASERRKQLISYGLGFAASKVEMRHAAQHVFHTSGFLN